MLVALGAIAPGMFVPISMVIPIVVAFFGLAGASGCQQHEPHDHQNGVSDGLCDNHGASSYALISEG
jgi:hypothetical protein